MQVKINDQTIELHQGDITLEQVDAIVNAANSRLAGGGGVDGAIHRRGGPSIMAETDAKYPDGCPTGSAVITTAGDLPAKYVLHELTVEHDCRSIAFPALSTGAYRYPIDQAARIALSTAIEFLKEHGRPELVRFVLFDAGAYGAFAAALEELT